MRTLLVLLAVAAPLPAADSDWPTDAVTLKNGAKFEGLIVEAMPGGLKFRAVKRPPGKPTLTFTTYFDTKEIATVARLSDADRQTLRDRLAALDPDGRGERRRMDGLAFAKPDKLAGHAATVYEGDQFTLVSTAPDEITRRAAVRLDQLYAAFARHLPPRAEPERPTRIELAGDAEQYRRLLAGPVLNPAVFDPATNRVVCGTDLRRLGDDLQRTRLHHVQQLAGIDKYEADLRELYKGNKADLDRFLQTSKKERDKVLAAERENDRTFDQATRRLFALLYHEAFHAYVAGYVYPKRSPAEVRGKNGTGELPRWLNEGLAQVFETPVVEAGELRVGHADPDRLKMLQADPVAVMPVADLLAAGREAFLAAHAEDKAASDRTYLAAYGLAFYLVFERRLVGTPAFDDFLVGINTGTPPAEAFAALVGQDLPAFERDWREYLKRLQIDGTVKK